MWTYSAIPRSYEALIDKLMTLQSGERLDGVEPKGELIRTVESRIASDPARLGGA